VALYSQERQTIVVPRGNRYAMMVTVSRANFGGEMVLGAETLPAGVTLQADRMPANLDTIPVVFEAAPNAVNGAQLTALTARHADPKQTVATRFHQQVEMIIGQPGQSIYWKYETAKAAVAVTDAVPFQINIVEPKVPLVQNGSLNLKIVAVRKPGFKAPITVLPLVNIPGVGTATSAVILENQTETTLVMNASGGAQVRKWKIAVIATATVGNGPVWVSSQLANLEVSPPFVTLAMERAAAEQGKSTEIFCKVQQHAPFTGNARVRILGLPNKVAAPEVAITKDTKELAFKVDVDKTSPAGQHRNIFCEVLLTQNGEPILQNTGSTELRIDVPLPPKANTPPPPKTTTVVNKPPEPAKAPEKRLTRLEKLRLEQEEREKAAKAGTPPPK
jgi:hypothetical protein